MICSFADARSMYGDGKGTPLCPTDISPKYDKGELGCEFIVYIVGFGGDLATGFFAET
jgi:hypothetical protein